MMESSCLSCRRNCVPTVGEVRALDEPCFLLPLPRAGGLELTPPMAALTAAASCTARVMYSGVSTWLAAAALEKSSATKPWLLAATASFASSWMLSRFLSQKPPVEYKTQPA
jgi:hypothetical protein